MYRHSYRHVLRHALPGRDDLALLELPSVSTDDLLRAVLQHADGAIVRAAGDVAVLIGPADSGKSVLAPPCCLA